MVGWNTGANAEMIQAAQSAFDTVVVGLGPWPYPAGHCHCNAGAPLARDESVIANPEFCQGLQIDLVSA